MGTTRSFIRDNRKIIPENCCGDQKIVDFKMISMHIATQPSLGHEFTLCCKLDENLMCGLIGFQNEKQINVTGLDKGSNLSVWRS